MNKKEAFKIVSEFISKYHPFSATNDRWDRENGSVKFISGFRCLEDFIATLAEDDFDIEKYENELLEVKKELKELSKYERRNI